LRLAIGAWSARDGRSFAELVDAVESQLRQIATNPKLKSSADSAAVALLHDATTVRG